MTDKRFTDKQVDVLAALVLAESCLNGPCNVIIIFFKLIIYIVLIGTKERLLIFRLAFSFGSRLVNLNYVFFKAMFFDYYFVFLKRKLVVMMKWLQSKKHCENLKV